MFARHLRALCLTMLSGLALSSLVRANGPQRGVEGITGQPQDIPKLLLDPNEAVSSPGLSPPMNQRLAKLEERFEQREQAWRKERESLKASVHRLEGENHRLEKMFEQKSCKGVGEPVKRQSSLQQIVLSQFNLRLSEVGADVAKLQTDMSAVQRNLSSPHQASAMASTYVRWGRSVCPGSAQLVYAGVVGGADYRGSGASTSVLCLPLNPVFGSVVKSRYYADLWGAEFQTHSSNPAQNNMDPMCAVCRPPRATNLMVPARNACDEGWVLEYSGHLMGSYPAHPGGHEFICMDANPEYRMGGAVNQEGLLLYLTFANCAGTSLPCPPYQHGKVITCAVCSK